MGVEMARTQDFNLNVPLCLGVHSYHHNPHHRSTEAHRPGDQRVSCSTPQRPTSYPADPSFPRCHVVCFGKDFINDQ